MVWADIYGLEHRPVMRADAMQIPAVVRARRLIAGTIARIPLVAENAAGPLEVQPAWIGRTDGGQTPYHRLLWTVDDLLFHGWSLWMLSRAADGTMLRASRVDFDTWAFDERGQVLIYPPGGTPYTADQRDVCLIPGVDEGLLAFGAPTFRHALNLLRNADKATANPAAYINLQQTNDAVISEEDIDRTISRWAQARQGKNGGISFTSKGIEAKEMGAPLSQLLLEGRNAAAVDIARLCGIPSALLDAATTGGGTITYANQVQRNLEFLDFGLSPLISAIVARLGMDDIVPRGTRIVADVSELTAITAPTVTVPDDAATPPVTPPPPAVPAESEVPA